MANATAVWDPLGYGAGLPCRGVFYPLGFPLELATNSFDVMKAAEESWHGYPPFFAERPIELRVAVSGDEAAEPASELVWRGQRHLVAMVSDARNFAMLDLPAGFAYCAITPATARNRPWLRHFYLDTIVNLILWQSHLTRIHAGCVALDGRGVLLCGESGAGKTCLTWACVRRGWTFVSDEAPSILRRTKARIVIGKPQYLHFRDSAFALFPELDGRPAAPNPVGKISFELRTAELPEIRTDWKCQVDAVVFLHRGEPGPARLAPLGKEEAWNRLERDLPLFEEPAHEEHKASLRNLLTAGTFELHYQDLDSAVERLERMVRQGGPK